LIWAVEGLSPERAPSFLGVFYAQDEAIAAPSSKRTPLKKSLDIIVFCSRLVCMTDHNLETMNKTDVERIERRTVQYWFEDGVAEIAFGIFVLILGLFFLGSALSPEKSTARFIFDIGLMPVILAGGWAVNRLARSMKRKLTYPRTGYVAYKRPEKRKRIKKALLAGGSAGLVAALAAVFFVSKPARLDAMPAFSGLAYALALVFVSLRAGLSRIAVVAVLTAAAGVGLAFAGWAKGLELAAFYGIVGLLLVLSGFIGLRSYLRRNPLPEEGSR